LKAILIGNKALWAHLTKDCVGYVNITTPNGSPVMWVSGLGRTVWVVDIINRLELNWVSEGGDQAALDIDELLKLL
jgi:hypothetical protein